MLVWINSAMNRHFYGLFRYLDPFEHCSDKKSREHSSEFTQKFVKIKQGNALNYIFLPQCVVMSLALVYEIITQQGLVESRQQLFLISPYQSIGQPFAIECINLIASFTCLAIYLSLVFNPIRHRKYRIDRSANQISKLIDSGHT